MYSSIRKKGVLALLAVFALALVGLLCVNFVSVNKANAWYLRYGDNGAFDYNLDHWANGQGSRVKGETKGKWYFGYGDATKGGSYSFTQCTKGTADDKRYESGVAHMMCYGFDISVRNYSSASTQTMYKWVAEADGLVKFTGFFGKYLKNGSAAVDIPWMNLNWGASQFTWYDGSSYTFTVYRIAKANNNVFVVQQKTFTSAFAYDFCTDKIAVKNGDQILIGIKVNVSKASNEWGNNVLGLVSSQYETYTGSGDAPVLAITSDNYYGHMTAQNVRTKNQTSGIWRYGYGSISTSGYSITNFVMASNGYNSSPQTPNNIFYKTRATASTTASTLFEWKAEHIGTVSFTGLAIKTSSDIEIFAGYANGYKPLSLATASASFLGHEYGWAGDDSTMKITIGMYKVAANGTVTQIKSNTYSKDFAWFAPTTAISVNVGDRIVFAQTINAAGSGWNTGTLMMFNPQFTYGDYVDLSMTFTKNMILQRNKQCNVAGTGTPGKTVSVNFAGQTKTATVNSSGDWVVKLDPMEASFTGRTMTVTIGTASKTLTGILVGDVWLCSGQSNMATTLYDLLTYKVGWTSYDPWSKTAAQLKTDLSNTALKDYYNYEDNFDKVRLFQVGYNPKTSPDKRGVDGTYTNWEYGWAMSGTLNQWFGYSAYALGFAFRLQQASGVPVGVITSAVGGSSVEEWISDATISEYKLTLLYDQSVKPHSRFYNGMLYPIRNSTIDGIMWYQGCADSGQYSDTAGWTSGWSDKMVGFTAQERKFYGDVPIIVQQLVQQDGWAFWQSMRQVQWDLQNRISKCYTSVGIGAGTPYDNLEPADHSNYIHPLDKYGISRNAANIARRYVYNDKNCNGIAAYPEKIYRSGSSVIIDYGALRDACLTLKSGSYVQNLRAHNTSNNQWVTVSNASIDGTKITVPNANSYDAFSYAGYNLMQSGATTKSAYISYPEWNSNQLINLYTSDGIPCAPFQYISVSSNVSTGQQVTISDDFGIKFTFCLSSFYSNPVVTFRFNGNTSNVTATKNSNGTYSATFKGVAPQDMNDKIYVDHITATGKDGHSESKIYLCETAVRNGNSVMDYLLALKNSDSSAKTQKLVVNMLNYGYYAQKYLNHDTANPINKNISTADQTAYKIAYNSTAVSQGAVRKLTGTKSDSAYWKSASIFFDNKVGCVFYFFVSSSVSGTVTASVSYGSTSKTISGSQFTITNVDGGKIYAYRVSDLSPSQLSTVLTNKILINGTQVGQTLDYNIYANINQLASAGDDYATLVKGLYSFSAAMILYNS